MGVGCCELGDGLSGSIKDGGFLAINGRIRSLGSSFTTVSDQGLQDWADRGSIVL
jgi:hypothetical protein